MIGSNSDGQLRSLIERIERLNEEEAAIKSDKRDIFAEAKSAGFDPKVMRRVIQIRAGDAKEIEAFDELVDLYLGAMNNRPAPARPARASEPVTKVVEPAVVAVSAPAPEKPKEPFPELPTFLDRRKQTIAPSVGDPLV